MAFIYNGQPISIDAPFTAPDGTRYPNLRSPELRAALGVTEVADEPAYDQRFYWGVGNPKLLNDREEVDQDGNPMWVQEYDPVTESMVNTDKRLVTKGLKSQWIAQVKDTAGKLLSRTDWYITRSVERNVAVPPTVVGYRTSVIAESERLESAIKLCTSVEQLIDIVNNQDWPKED